MLDWFRIVAEMANLHDSGSSDVVRDTGFRNHSMLCYHRVHDMEQE